MQEIDLTNLDLGDPAKLLQSMMSGNIKEHKGLNNLVGNKLSIGNIKVEGHDLCRPCKHLEETLNGKDIIKEFLRRGGLRCEILTSGIINLQDKITIL